MKRLFGTKTNPSSATLGIQKTLLSMRFNAKP